MKTITSVTRKKIKEKKSQHVNNKEKMKRKIKNQHIG